MIGIVIPTRGDRTIFLSRCLEMISNQTVVPDHIQIVSEPPKSNEKDITYRYRRGFEKLAEKGCKVIFLIEDDDFYSERYIETMLKEWENAGQPDVFGIGETIYYHLTRRKYSKMIHPNRSSAFSTMVTDAVLQINFPEDNYPFLDLEIWKQLSGKTFVPEHPLCMGLKHNVGICGGRGHLDGFPYHEEDPDYSFLRKITGNRFNSYMNLLNQIEK